MDLQIVFRGSLLGPLTNRICNSIKPMSEHACTHSTCFNIMMHLDVTYHRLCDTKSSEPTCAHSICFNAMMETDVTYTISHDGPLKRIC